MTKRSATARPYPVRIQRVPVGPLALTVLDECRRWFAAKGYSPGSAAAAVNLAQRLSAWMEEAGAGIDEIDEDLLDRFVTAERSRERPCSSVKPWLAPGSCAALRGYGLRGDLRCGHHVPEE